MSDDADPSIAAQQKLGATDADPSVTVQKGLPGNIDFIKPSDALKKAGQDGMFGTLNKALGGK